MTEYHDTREAETESCTIPLTPSAFLESVAAKLDRLHEGGSGVLLRAIPIKPTGYQKVYGGFVYAAMKGPHTGEFIDARIRQRDIVRFLKRGREIIRLHQS